MRPRLQPERVRKTKWYEYLVRFAFGGTITAVAGYLAHRYGPGVGGLFLAFPAILPASATLIEKHEGHRAAGLDAAGAAYGCVGLGAFGAIVWGLGAKDPAWLVLLLGLAAWLSVSAALWIGWQKLRKSRRLERRRRNPHRRGAPSR